eukprot:scaffold10151_cov136-Skeletonema_menzelii.AAC.3
MELLMAIVRDTQNERYTPMNRLIIFLDDLTLIAVAVMLMWSLSLLGAYGARRTTTDDSRSPTFFERTILDDSYIVLSMYIMNIDAHKASGAHVTYMEHSKLQSPVDFCLPIDTTLCLL